MSSAADSFGREENVKGRESKVKIGIKETVCLDEIGEKNAFATTDETRLTGRGGRNEKKKRKKRVRKAAKVELQ